jgi:SAM-dependent methyltransferase
MSMFGDLRGSDFLQAWHARFAGGTAKHHASARVVGIGVSTYELLVRDVAEQPKLDAAIDIACGDGYLIQLLSERFPDAAVLGVDASSEELRLARERAYAGGVRFEEARVEAIPVPSGSVDAVVCHLAFMLFDDAGVVVREIARVLRPGGTFAAVFGPAGGMGPGIRGFGGKLREIESREALSRLDVGDPATDNEETARGLFDPREWRAIEMTGIALRFETGDEVREMLMAMYNIARFSESGKAEIDAYLRSATSGPFDPADWQMGLRHLVARRA